MTYRVFNKWDELYPWEIDEPSPPPQDRALLYDEPDDLPEPHEDAEFERAYARRTEKPIQPLSPKHYPGCFFTHRYRPLKEISVAELLDGRLKKFRIRKVSGPSTEGTVVFLQKGESQSQSLVVHADEDGVIIGFERKGPNNNSELIDAIMIAFGTPMADELQANYGFERPKQAKAWLTKMVSNYDRDAEPFIETDEYREKIAEVTARYYEAAKRIDPARAELTRFCLCSRAPFNLYRENSFYWDEDFMEPLWFVKGDDSDIWVAQHHIHPTVFKKLFEKYRQMAGEEWWAQNDF